MAIYELKEKYLEENDVIKGLIDYFGNNATKDSYIVVDYETGINNYSSLDDCCYISNDTFESENDAWEALYDYYFEDKDYKSFDIECLKESKRFNEHMMVQFDVDTIENIAKKYLFTEEQINKTNQSQGGQ